MPSYVALDPGGTTGICIFDTEKQSIELMQLGPQQHHLELYDILSEVDPDYVICEGFEYRNTSRAGLVLDSKEYIGVAKLYALLRNIPYIEQTAAMAKGFVPDKGAHSNATLKKLDWYKPNMKHANDASRHMIYFLVNGKHDDANSRLWVLNTAYR